MEQAYGLVAMRLYVTKDKKVAEQNEGDEEGKNPDDIKIPNNLIPFLRVGRPNLGGLVDQAVDEGVNMGRVGIVTCGSQGVNLDVKNAVIRNLCRDMPDIYCHCEQFDF
jgi:hypothetical protein